VSAAVAETSPSLSTTGFTAASGEPGTRPTSSYCAEVAPEKVATRGLSQIRKPLKLRDIGSNHGKKLRVSHS
jgi:hypothetical protein